jgi:hypothetical protein
MSGYAVCLYDHGERFPNERAFYDYVANRYDCKLTLGTTGIIQRFAKDDAEAFDIFVKLLEEYIAETGWKPHEE